MEFRPPISNRATVELIEIANSSTEFWQQAAIDQAKVELEKREISKEYQQSVIDEWFEEEKMLEIAYQKQLLLNETERYTWGEMLGILFASPFIMAGRWYFELSLPELKRQNFKKKFK